MWQFDWLCQKGKLANDNCYEKISQKKKNNTTNIDLNLELRDKLTDKNHVL